MIAVLIPERGKRFLPFFEAKWGSGGRTFKVSNLRYEFMRRYNSVYDGSCTPFLSGTRLLTGISAEI